MVFVIVPNAPCGVESRLLTEKLPTQPLVPNAPCGVESLLPHTGRKTGKLRS